MGSPKVSLPTLMTLAHTFNCVCHCIRVMFRVLGMYNFGLAPKKEARPSDISTSDLPRIFDKLFDMKAVEI